MMRLIQYLILFALTLVSITRLEAGFIEMEFCQSDYPISIESDSVGISYLWNTGDTTQQIVLNDSGKYIVTVTLDSATTHLDTFQITTLGLPDIDILKGEFSTASKLWLNPSGNNISHDDSYVWTTPLNTYENDSSALIIWPCQGLCNDSVYSTVSISLVVENNCGADTAYYPIECDSFNCTPTSIDDQSMNSRITLYPNPTENNVVLELGNSGEPHFIRVTDLQGQMITKDYVGSNIESTVLNVKGASPEIYLVTVRGRQTGTVRSVKLVVQ